MKYPEDIRDKYIAIASKSFGLSLDKFKNESVNAYDLIYKTMELIQNIALGQNGWDKTLKAFDKDYTSLYCYLLTDVVFSLLCEEQDDVELINKFLFMWTNNIRTSSDASNQIKECAIKN